MVRNLTPALGLCALLSALLCASLAGQLPVAEPWEVGLSSDRLERIGEVFQGYVDDGRIAGAIGMVARQGRLVYADQWGSRDLAAGDDLEADDIFRIFSMTKPITSVAVMMLHEEGHFFLTDPIGRYIPELAQLHVAQLEGQPSPDDIPTERARPITIQDLLRHTSGLSYGIFSNTAVDQLYRRQNVLGQATIADMVTELSKIPLVYQPGTQWNYSVSVDVLGRLVEVVSGQPLDVFLRERIFQPLGMVDTGFYVPSSKRDRLSRLYGHVGRERTLTLGDTTGYTEAVTMFSGGGGLVGTAADYMRFAQMLLNGGELDGTRILGRATIDLMTVDHLGDAPTGWLSPGWGFGLGFTVRNEAGRDGTPGSVGEYYWFGIAGTSFWVDPAEELIGVFMVQMRPSRDLAYRQQFKNLVYQALIG